MDRRVSVPWWKVTWGRTACTRDDLVWALERAQLGKSVRFTKAEPELLLHYILTLRLKLEELPVLLAGCSHEEIIIKASKLRMADTRFILKASLLPGIKRNDPSLSTLICEILSAPDVRLEDFYDPCADLVTYNHIDWSRLLDEAQTCEVRTLAFLMKNCPWAHPDTATVKAVSQLPPDKFEIFQVLLNDLEKTTALYSHHIKSVLETAKAL